MKKILRESGLSGSANYLSKMKGQKKRLPMWLFIFPQFLQQLITHTHLIQGEINFFMNASGEPIDMKDERLSSSIPQIPTHYLNS